MSLAPSLVWRSKLGGTIRVLVGDTNIRYLAELNGSRVYCDDIRNRPGSSQLLEQTAIALLGQVGNTVYAVLVSRRFARRGLPCFGCSEALR